jgi:hypothetical protein
MLGLQEDEVDRTAVAGVAEVVEATAGDTVTAGAVATASAATPWVVATVLFQLGRGQIFRACDPFGNIRDIVTGRAHWRHS